jgi:NAD(P)H-nitrite reductase large subunit
MPKYVIIGGSAAGIGAVEAIREIDPVGTIAVISEEVCSQYSRPMISDFVSGKADLEKMKCREDTFWKENNAEPLMGKKATALKLAEKYLELDDGIRVEFEKLLLATGGKPFVPKIEGANKENVFTFTTFSDAERLAEKVETSKKAIVIGAGLIGISVTEALVKRGLKVTLVELQDRILSLILDPKASGIVENIIKKAGVNVVTGQSVQKVISDPENGEVTGVTLTSGTQLPCEIVIVAIGVVPRTELAIGTMLKTNRGILVDKYLETNVPNVFAAGDVAEAFDFVLNENRLLPLWPLAMIEGKIAGYNMAGKKTDYSGGTSMSALKYFGVPIISVGLANPKIETSYEILTKYDENREIYKKLVLKNDVIMGMTFLNSIERAGIIFNLMKNNVNVGEFKNEILSEDFGLASLPRDLRQRLYTGV